MVLALAAFGFRKTFVLFFRFPGAILLPMFTPLTFGPVLGSCSPCFCCSRTASNCDCKLTKSPMELSFTFTYINVVISAIGGTIFFLLSPGILHFHPEPVINILIGFLSYMLPVLVLQFIFIGIFHMFEKRCLCCCNFCFPFTKRETFDIGDAPAWRDAMTDLSHLYQDTPDVMVEGEAIELENLGKGGLILKGIYFQFGPKSRKLLWNTMFLNSFNISKLLPFQTWKQVLSGLVQRLQIWNVQRLKWKVKKQWFAHTLGGFGAKLKISSEIKPPLILKFKLLSTKMNPSRRQSLNQNTQVRKSQKQFILPSILQSNQRFFD